MPTTTIVRSIDEIIDGRRLLDHPFYTAWSAGQLTSDALRRYAEQYYHWVASFPTFLSAVHANCDDLEMRQSLVRNLVDEELSPLNHLELWLRFCDALGLSRRAVRTADLLPETRQALMVFRRLCRESAPVVGLAALYAFESQQPEVMQEKRHSLSTVYGVTSGHDYFEVHETLDVEHSAVEQQEIERLAAGHETDVLVAVRVALDATYILLDGVERLGHQMEGG